METYRVYVAYPTQQEHELFWADWAARWVETWAAQNGGTRGGTTHRPGLMSIDVAAPDAKLAAAVVARITDLAVDPYSDDRSFEEMFDDPRSKLHPNALSLCRLAPVPLVGPSTPTMFQMAKGADGWAHVEVCDPSETDASGQATMLDAWQSTVPWARTPEADPREGYDPDQGREIGLWERGWPLRW